MRHSVSNLIGKFARATLAPSEIFQFKKRKRQLKREWNRCGQHQRAELRRKMEDAL